MPLEVLLRRNPVAGLAVTLALAGVVPQSQRLEAEGFLLIGSQAWRPAPLPLTGPRLSVFEADAWRHSLIDGALQPIPQVPLPSSFWDRFWPKRHTDLMRGARFTPAAYLAQIASLRDNYCQQRDILMYYGGIRRRPHPEGLNFNAWSAADLKKLRAFDGRPFIGLETMERKDIRALFWRLREAGYGRQQRIYVRIGSEPGYSAYGTEDGTPTGRRHTVAAYTNYQRKFTQTAEYINELNRRHGLNVHTLFAGASSEDFEKYQPAAGHFDALGYDLYVTPENKSVVLRQLRLLARKYPYKPLVLPEFGVATAGRAADPYWAVDALADVLGELGRHPAGVEAITIFSVNVPARISARRWSWAWTPQMYEMLKEWQASPRSWRKEGFHRYDPLSYPVGRDFLFLQRAESKIVYRKLARFKSANVPLFHETRFFLNDRKEWVHRARTVFFDGRVPKEI